MKQTKNSILASVLLFATAFAGTAAAATKYALCVGINEYSLAGCGTLRGCVNDARYFHSNLISLGDWSASNMTKLTDRSATKTAIRNAIAGYASRAVSGDTFIYMHSSHGGWNSGTSTYLCAYDACYEDTELAADLARFPAGAKVVVVVDACHSGGLFKGDGEKAKLPPFDLAQRVSAIMDDNRAKSLAAGEKGVEDKLASSEIGWVTAADYDESSYDDDSYGSGDVGAVFLCGFTEGWWNGRADTTGVGDRDGYMDGYEGWKYGYDYCSGQTPQYHNTNALRRVELGRSGTTPPPPAQERVRIAFNANGGSCGTTSRTIAEGTAIGTLPTAARRGYRLIGWYTARTGGERITASSTFSSGCTLYARWAKALYTVAYNANGGRGRMAAQRMTYGTASRLRANAFVRTGYVFIGWARTRGGAVAYTNRQAVRNLRNDGRTTTLYAKWAKRTYKVAFNANGGTGRMAPQAFYYGRAGRLRANAFTRRGYTFGGWATTPGGDLRYVNRQAVKNLRTDGRTTTLYAFWQLPLPTALDTSLAFTTGGNAKWFGQTADNHDGTDAARSGKISHNQDTWMQTTVTGPGTISFWWKVSCEEGYDYLQFFVDGVEQRCITGPDGWWVRVSLNILEGGTHVLKWNYHKDVSVSSGSDRGWVDQVAWTPFRTCDLNTALDNASLFFTTDGDGNAPWFGQTTVSHDGSDAAQCGGIADSQSTWLQATVTGPGTVSFWWNVSSESGYDKLSFLVDGQEVASISGTGSVWAQKSATVSGSGSHTLKWAYSKDGSVSNGSDCGWVDQVSWSASSTPPSTSANKYALCVGINQYSLSGCSTLRGCVNDAAHFFGNLRDRGGWPAGNMTKLTDSGATKTAIRNAIAGYASRASSGDTFVYMHSSHGGQNSGTSTFLCAHDDYYEDTELASDLARFPAGAKVVVVVDACHSGGLFKGDGSGKAPVFGLAERVSAIMDDNRAKSLARGEKGVLDKLSSSEIGWVTAADYDESSYDGGSYETGDVGGEFLCAFTEGWRNGQADSTGVGDRDGYLDGYEGWKYGYDACSGQQTPQYYNASALRRVELGTCGGSAALTCDLRTAVDNTSLSFTTGGSASWIGQKVISHDGVDAARSGVVSSNQTTWMQTTVTGPGTVSFWWNVSSESGYDKLSFLVDGQEVASISGTNVVWAQKSSSVSGSGSHTLKWSYSKDGSVSRGSDCGWVDQVSWSASSTPPSTSANKYALCVGINQYSLSGCSTLRGCVNDAAHFFGNLRDRGGWPAGNMTKLTDSGATKTAIRNAIAGYASRASSGDTFVYVHSSHGGQNSGTSTFLCAYNDYYEDTELASDLARFPAGAKVVVVVDACHSGGLFKGDGKAKAPSFDLAQRVSAIMDDNRAKSLARGEKGVLDKLSSSEIGWVTAADYDESSYDGGSYETGDVGGEFLCAFTEGWRNGQADSTGVGDGDGYLDGYEGWKYGADACGSFQSPQYYNANALRRVELGTCGLVQTCDLRTAVDNTSLSFTTGGSASWVGQSATSHDGVDAARSGIVSSNQTTWMQTTVTGPGTVSFWWNVSSESGYDKLSFLVDGQEIASISGTNVVWAQKSSSVSGSGSHTLKWSYSKDGSVSRGSDCGWVDQVVWSASRAVSGGEEAKAAETAGETTGEADAEDAESGIGAETDATGGDIGGIAIGGETDSIVLAVTASDGEDAGAVADGDEETAWTPDVSNGAWVVLTLADEVDVGDIEVVGDNLSEGIRFLLSADAEEWTEAVPGRAQYVWVVFPASGEAVSVKEIRVLSE